ncbi:hypothetical protein GY45DRAFT_732299 [Cubamyces sp. BRFM 1775]|nr:hypothetical protein GY45DRAFT_732299 [Cubamyces sp. BRFM 1775]
MHALVRSLQGVSLFNGKVPTRSYTSLSLCYSLVSSALTHRRPRTLARSSLTQKKTRMNCFRPSFLCRGTYVYLLTSIETHASCARVPFWGERGDDQWHRWYLRDGTEAPTPPADITIALLVLNDGQFCIVLACADCTTMIDWKVRIRSCNNESGSYASFPPSMDDWVSGGILERQAHFFPSTTLTTAARTFVYVSLSTRYRVHLMVRWRVVPTHAGPSNHPILRIPTARQDSARTQLEEGSSIHLGPDGCDLGPGLGPDRKDTVRVLLRRVYAHLVERHLRYVATWRDLLDCAPYERDQRKPC